MIKQACLTIDQINEGCILTCCSTIQSDAYLDIDDLGILGTIPKLTLPCRIDEIEKITNDVMRLVLRLPPQSNFIFLEGQYINLIKNDIRRSYSIANSLRSDGKIELFIKNVSNGEMSNYLFSNAACNDLLRFEGPIGTFSYRENSYENIVFLATGTGIAPVKAILEGMIKEKNNKNIYVIWGQQKKEDFFYDLKYEISSWKYIYATSREKSQGFYNGYVQDALLEIGLDLTKTQVYACGSKSMIDESFKKLQLNGLNEESFFSDAFVSSN